MMITVVDHQGEKHEISFYPGDNLLDRLDDCGIELLKIRSDCGGLCACVTCHVYVDYPFNECCAEPTADEQIMLTQVKTPLVGSRLACEIVLDEHLDGAVIRLAPGSEIEDE